MHLDDEEVAVYCGRCNGYLYAKSIYEVDALSAQQRVMVLHHCPYWKPNYPPGDQCQPPLNEGRYGRS